MVPKTMRPIHRLASSTLRGSTATIFQMKAMTNASAPMLPARLWPYPVQISITCRSWSISAPPLHVGDDPLLEVLLDRFNQPLQDLPLHVQLVPVLAAQPVGQTARERRRTRTSPRRRGGCRRGRRARGREDARIVRGQHDALPPARQAVTLADQVDSNTG